MDLAEGVLDGNRLALARLLTQIENKSPDGIAALDSLFPHTGQAYLVGVTGAPGAGKSTLVNKLTLSLRKMPSTTMSQSKMDPNLRIAIVAIDPSSPFTGGALLGDRVRMRDLFGDKGIFIRSMATRGALGGLAVSTSGVVQVLDAAGFDFIIIETVGAGQAEIDIASLANTTIVVEAPGFGDEIQAIKAGILEIADILVINKADHPGIDLTERALKSMLQLGHPMQPNHRKHHDQGDAEISFSDNDYIGKWIPPIIKTIATEGSGIDKLVESIFDHFEFLRTTGELSKLDHLRLKSEFDFIIRETLVSRWRSGITDKAYDEVLTEVLNRRTSPRTAVNYLIDRELNYDLR